MDVLTRTKMKSKVRGVRQPRTAIEDPSFPFEHLSQIAELESWRKEVNRPIYHVHKWWAQRLGSVFRAVILGAFSPPGSDIIQAFYSLRRPCRKIIFDPFMGSGTTVGEAVKLGFRAIGRDINPVSHFLVRNAVAQHCRADILREFDAIEADVAPRIRHFYQTPKDNGQHFGGQLADVLYYFWVKVLACPNCGHDVDLFSRYVFSQHAYVKKYPQARAVCPLCGEINTVLVDAESAKCRACRGTYHPQAGPAQGQQATCSGCDHKFAIAKAAKAMNAPPRHRMYAKMVLLPDGEKEYQGIGPTDVMLYDEATQALAAKTDAYPIVEIQPGYNTNQSLGYNYTHWHLMFNARQLLCLSLMADRIRRIEDTRTRDLFACLLSGCLEFNNMFASFKGEGTGAVRHMFSHHILKPERTPLEANLWGTPRSSGAFSTLFRSRILRAIDYQADPFELRVVQHKGKTIAEKVVGASHRIQADIASSYTAFLSNKAVYLTCGDSSQTDLPDRSVDAVITDPPFFDNVHYSELADFFHVWQRHILGNGETRGSTTTRCAEEVQQTDPKEFAARLGAVWKECHRVLRDEGVLAFSYHHSRTEGWGCVLNALVSARFVITATFPIKAEMSVAAPKMLAKEPIDYDIIIVCRKRAKAQAMLPIPFSHLLVDAFGKAKAQATRLLAVGRSVSRNDIRIILMSQVIRLLSEQGVTDDDPVAAHGGELEAAIDRMNKRTP